jgi:hypothetical protein
VADGLYISLSSLDSLQSRDKLSAIIVAPTISSVVRVRTPARALALRQPTQAGDDGQRSKADEGPSSTDEHGPLLGRAMDFGNLLRAKFSEALSGVVPDSQQSGQGSASGIENSDNDEFYSLRSRSEHADNAKMGTIREDSPLKTSQESEPKAPALPNWVRRGASDSRTTFSAPDRANTRQGSTHDDQSDAMVNSFLEELAEDSATRHAYPPNQHRAGAPAGSKPRGGRSEAQPPPPMAPQWEATGEALAAGRPQCGDDGLGLPGHGVRPHPPPPDLIGDARWCRKQWSRAEVPLCTCVCVCVYVGGCACACV